MTLPGLAMVVSVLAIVIGGGFIVALFADYLIGVFERERTLRELDRRLKFDDAQRKRRGREGPIAARFNERRR